MMSFGDDLMRLADEIVSGHETRTASISGISTQVRENRAAGNARRGDMRKSMRAGAAESAAARSADRHERSAEVLDFRQTNQNLIRSDMANLRKTLEAARQELAGTVGTLRSTMRTVHAKSSTDLRNQLGADLTKLRGDMQQQFDAARSAWRGDGKAPRARSAPTAAVPPVTSASAVAGGAAARASVTPAPAFVAPVTRKDAVAPQANPRDVETTAMPQDEVQRVA